MLVPIPSLRGSHLPVSVIVEGTEYTLLLPPAQVFTLRLSASSANFTSQHLPNSRHISTRLYLFAMRFLPVALTTWSLISVISAAPLGAPERDDELPDGMPYPSPSELDLIERNAHGTLPNTPPPPVISDQGILNLQLIAFNELFEVAFFHELLTNITESVDGYRFQDSGDRDFVIRAFRAILAVRFSFSCCLLTSTDF